VLSVLLALGANDLRQSWEVQARVDRSVQAIAREARENQSTLQKRIDAHQALQAEIDTVLTRLQTNQRDWFAPLRNANFGFVGLSDAALRSAQREGAFRHLPVQTAQHFTAMLQLKDTAARLREYIREQAARINTYPVVMGRPLDGVQPTYNALSNIRNYLRDLIAVEQQLLQMSQEAPPDA
jgi:hypothetical protein